MKFKRVLVNPCKFYEAKINRYSKIKDEYELLLHWHFAYEIIYVASGCLQLSKPDDCIELRAGDVYVLNSQEVHSYHSLEDNTEAIIINSLPNVLFKEYQFLEEPLKYQIKDCDSKNIIAKSLSVILDFDNFEDKVTALKIKAILYNVSYYLVRDFLAPDLEYKKGSEFEEYDCARTAITYMIENYKKDISLNEISKHVGMSPSHFSKYFKEKTTSTFSHFLHRIRLEHALNDIRKNNCTVKDAALNNGFPNVNSLIKTCKLEYGHTPYELKQLQKQSDLP